MHPYRIFRKNSAMHCQVLVSRPMVVELADGEEGTINVYGYRCEEDAVPTANACPQHLNRDPWWWAA